MPRTGWRKARGFQESQGHSWPEKCPLEALLRPRVGVATSSRLKGQGHKGKSSKDGNTVAERARSASLGLGLS